MLNVLLLLSAAIIGSTLAQTCSWQLFPDTKISGGTYAPASTVTDCQATCRATAGCQAVDFNVAANGCYLLNTQSGKAGAAGVNHYDYVCTAPPPPDPCSPNPCQNGGQCSSSSGAYTCTCSTGFTGSNCQTAQCKKTDILKLPNIQNALTTSYDGSVYDVINFPSGAYWTVPVPSFSINWPFLLQLFPITELRYASATNLAYIRVEFTDSSGAVSQTDAFTAKSYPVSGVRSLNKLTVYLTPNDISQNVSITGFTVNYCALPNPLGGCLSVLNAFLNPAFTLLNIITLGVFNLQNGAASYSGRADYPYVEVDLTQLGLGTSEFNRVALNQYTNIRNGIVKIWDNDYPVTVQNTQGVVSENFGVDPSSPSSIAINFAPGTRGNRIRVQILPNPPANQGTSFSFRYTSLSILIC